MGRSHLTNRTAGAGRTALLRSRRARDAVNGGGHRREATRCGWDAINGGPIVDLSSIEVVGIWPFLPMIATLFGYGAVLLLAWRTLRWRSLGTPAGLANQAAAPLAT
jgi:hypothetical protein